MVLLAEYQHCQRKWADGLKIGGKSKMVERVGSDC